MYVTVNTLYFTALNHDVPQLRDAESLWYRWDTPLYIGIATDGYHFDGSQAFFPLYPLLIRGLVVVLPGHKLVAALIVASLACIAALAVLYRLAEDMFERGTAQRTVLYLMASPFAFYLVAAYNESLFVALVVASLYCMRRGHWWWAGAFAGLASGTRYFGLILGVSFVIEYLRQRDWRPLQARWDALAVLLVPTGLVAFMIYLARTTGDPLKFAHLQEQNWGHTLSLPWQGAVEAVGSISQLRAAGGPVLSAAGVLNVVDLATLPVVLALLTLSVVGPWRLGRPAWYLVAFGAMDFLGVLMSPMIGYQFPMHGLPRYALEMVPIYLVLGRLGARPAFDRGYLLPAIAAQVCLLIAYFSGVFVS
jgi:hypothetical protein